MAKINKTVGENIRKIRKKKGLTQEQLAHEPICTEHISVKLSEERKILD